MCKQSQLIFLDAVFPGGLAKIIQKQALVSALILISSFSILSCQNYSITGGPGPLVVSPLSTQLSNDFRPLRVNSIAVLPFEKRFNPAISETELAEFSQLLIASFQASTSLELLNMSEAKRSEQVLDKITQAALPLRTQASKLGQELGAQGVLYGNISEYRSEASRSSVALKLWLIEPTSGKTLWLATYRNQEQPLTDNIFRLKHNLKDGIAEQSPAALVHSGFLDAAQALEAERKLLWKTR